MSSQVSTSSNSPLPMDTLDSCCSTSWSSSDTNPPSSRIAGTKRKLANPSHYLRGKARAPFKSPSLGNTLSPLTPIASSAEQQSRVKACSRCSPVPYTLIPAFQAAAMHGPSLHNCHMSHPTPKKARIRQHQNVKGENAWILGNLFDSQGNYKFCHHCILAWLDVHKGRLAHLRKVKQQQQLQPLQHMTKKGG